MQNTWVAGVDGCRGGWFAVLRLSTSGALRFVLCEQFLEILVLPEAPAVVAVDIPIGLLDTACTGGRDCDRAARRILGRARCSSVFTPPTRRALAARNYRRAIELNRCGLSIQAFGILPKIREVDRAMNPARQDIVYEAHPELAFARLAGAPMVCNKKTRGGRTERERLLQRRYGRCFVVPNIVRQRFGRARVAIDDVLDAYALAYTATRIANGSGRCVPAHSVVRDRKSLRMEIRY
ncbi:MAG: DUF429 domain-containing protein [Acidiferrobacterales bacterium]